ncbi:MAG: transketolase family protein [Spirochaetes bacterium]|nr:transketolase family protein [Spirochaetota bacterium]
MGKPTRASFGEALVELGEKNKKIVALDADLSRSVKTAAFAEKFPERFFEIGIAESNMVGVAAGLALSGFIPFCASFAAFVAGRFETIRMSVAYCQANVKIVGTHCGLGIGEDGNSQMGLEDLSIMRSLPGMVVIQPVDHVETKQAVAFAVQHQGPVYLRLTRQDVEDVNPRDYSFQFGKGVVLKKGKDIVLFATGALVYHTLEAALSLEKEGINAEVINIHTLKPIDNDLVIQKAKEFKRIMTLEDHNIIGGLGSAVAEVLSENEPVKIKRIGVMDVFGESGSPDELYQKYGFDKEGIMKSIKAFMKS